MGGKDRAVAPSVGDQQDHSPDAQVALDADTPFERLEIVQSGLGLDHLVHRRTIDNDVRAPKVAGYWHGDFRSPSERACDTQSKSFDERRVGGVADRRTRRKQADSKIKTKTRSNDRDPVHSHPSQLASLEAADGGMRQARDSADRPLTQAGSQSSRAQFVARALTLSPSHPCPALTGAIVCSHVGMVGSGPYLLVNRSSLRGQPVVTAKLAPGPFQRADEGPTNGRFGAVWGRTSFNPRPNPSSFVRWNTGGASQRPRRASGWWMVADDRKPELQSGHFPWPR
jgi:hypothetical protein